MRFCFDCRYYLALRPFPDDPSEPFHLCRLPSACAPSFAADDAPYEDGGRSAYLGASCDVMRQREAFCGPHGRMWEKVPVTGAVR